MLEDEDFEDEESTMELIEGYTEELISNKKKLSKLDPKHPNYVNLSKRYEEEIDYYEKQIGDLKKSLQPKVKQKQAVNYNNNNSSNSISEKEVKELKKQIQLLENDVEVSLLFSQFILFSQSTVLIVDFRK